MKKKLSIIISLLCILVFVGCGKGSETADVEQPETKDSGQITIINDGTSNIKADDFLNLKIGDKYVDVVKSLGEPNILNTTNGENLYTWNGEEGYSISVVVKEDIITSKSSSDNSTINSNITKEMYDKVELGTTKEEAEKILGKGNLTYETKKGDKTESFYSYRNEDNSSVILTYVDNILTNHSENNLK